ncbi:MAG: PAS domain S-box protein [Oscillochloridaceae bacterium umkhey_bin13]
MLKPILAWFHDLPFTDRIQRSQGFILQLLIGALIASRLVFIGYVTIIPGEAPAGQGVTLNLIVIAALLVILTLLRRGQLQLATICLIGLVITIATQTIARGGFQTSGIIAVAYMVVIALAGLLLARHALIIVTAICCAALFSVAVMIDAPGVPTSSEAIFFTMVAAAFALLIDRYRATWEQIVETAHADEERLRLALDAGGMGTWDWDLRSNVIIWEGHHARIVGLEEGVFDGRYSTFAKMVHPDDLSRLEAGIRRAREQLVPFAEEYRVIWPDGTIRWTVGRGRYLTDRTGKPVRMLGVLADITERKQNELRLSAAITERDTLLSRLRLVLDRTPIGVIISDQSFLITYWNPAAEQIFGWSADEVIEHRPDEFIMTPEVLARLASIRNQISNSHMTMHIEGENLRRDGTYIRCEWINTPLHNEQGQFTGFLAMVQDVTERRRREIEIHELNADLERRVAERTAELAAKNYELEVFAYSVSHDLKAPLRGIDGYSRLLQEDFANRLDGDGPYYLEMIRAATGRMGQLIDDLLAYSRVERRTMSLTGVNLQRVVTDVLDVHAAFLHEADAQVTLTVAPLIVQAEEEGLSQTMRNLIENAIKFSQSASQPQIQIGAKQEGAMALIWVRDNGIGFAMEYHDKIFSLFQRLHRAEDYPGTGIGLAIVRKAIERSGGSVWAESSPGQGATFFVRLPLSETLAVP